MTDFINGAAAMGFAVSGLCFLKFWKRSGDRLFFLFAMGFIILGANRLVRMLLEENGQSLIPYVLRLLAFVMIIAAIVDRNLRRG